MKDMWKGVIAVCLVVVAVILLIVTVVPVSYRNQIAERERFVVQAKDTCAVQIDNGSKAIIQMAQVDVDTKNFLTKLFENATKDPNSELGREIDDAYIQFVGGNTQPMMLLMSGLAKTDITATATAVQREISAQRSIMSACSVSLLQAQKSVKDALGWDASGRTVEFPQTWMHLRVSDLSDPNLRDNDFDGRITVLDYRPPVDSAVMNSFNTGEGIPAENPYENRGE